MRPKYHVMTGLQMNEGIIWETEIIKVNKKQGKNGGEEFEKGGSKQGERRITEKLIKESGRSYRLWIREG